MANPKIIFNNLYGLLMEINFHRSEEDILAELEAKPDSQVEDHLKKIKKLSAKLQAESNKIRFQHAIEQINALRKAGLEELKKYIKPQETDLVPLFRKFEQLTKEDEASIIEDQELIHLIEILKNRIDEDTNH